jgi:hypothetical protein
MRLYEPRDAHGIVSTLIDADFVFAQSPNSSLSIGYPVKYGACASTSRKHLDVACEGITEATRGN